MKTVEYNRQFYSKCNNGYEICPLVEGLEGVSTRKISFILQIIYSGLAFCVLGYDIKEDSFFVSMLLFSAPLFFEYFFYKSKHFLNNAIYFIQKLSFFWGMVNGGLGGLTNVLRIHKIQKEVYIKISEDFFLLQGAEYSINWVMIPLLISILLIFTNIFSLDSGVEKMENKSNNKKVSEKGAIA